VARVLVVGCGCRGRALATALAGHGAGSGDAVGGTTRAPARVAELAVAGGHAVRGTTRDPARVAELEAAGIEAVLADPDRLATLVPALSGVTVVCWLMGTAAGSRELHGARLRTLMEHLVDTPVRGLVYEAAGSVEPDLLSRGAEIVRTASHTWHIPAEVVTVDPAEHEAWLAAMTEGVERVLTA
jgi:uncharacterized protein YbjT (DUF2867 family)